MKVADQELKKAVQSIIDDAPKARAQARNQGSEYHAWFTRVEIVVDSLGNRGVVLARQLQAIQDPKRYEKQLMNAHMGAMRSYASPDLTPMYEMMVDGGLGVMQATISAIDGGLLTAIEDRVASEIYGDVLTQAADLLNGGHLACAAIFVRVGLENGLKRRARRESMADVDKAKVAVVNDWLWKNNLYPKATHDAVQGWLAPGNAFAHDLPEKDQYTHRDIAKALQDVQSFLGTLLV